MKILYVHQYFKTPEEGGSIRSYYLAKGLVEAGHEVTMITAHNAPYEVKKIDGIDVHYLPVPYDNSFGFAQRLWAFWSFVKLAKREARILQKHDLAYVMTTPLTTGFIATFLKKELNLPYYFEVGDLWPEAPVRLGVIKNKWVKKWLYSLEKKFYFEADKVIALSPAIRNYIEKVSPNTKVYVIPNMADCTFFEAEYSVGDFSEHNKFQITYCGAIGKANQLEFLINAAEQSKAADLPVHFNIIGYGSELKRLKNVAKRLKNVSFYPHSSKKCVKNLLDKSDAVYVSFKDVKVLGTGSPNKFFDSLAAGKLTIINFDGWIRNLITKNKCGFHHDPHSKSGFVRKLKVFLESPELLAKYQRNGRKLAELYYDKDIQITKLLKILNNEYKFEVTDSEVYILTA
ncbi:glycosyltransferase family 4 protein [Ekhidna sp.]|uniref:glycosyltransferase family 4 protein n=1 Tax=Ekhidna sp. TaxID=2608089 RepID=UPI003B50AA92